MKTRPPLLHRPTPDWRARLFAPWARFTAKALLHGGTWGTPLRLDSSVGSGVGNIKCCGHGQDTKVMAVRRTSA